MKLSQSTKLKLMLVLGLVLAVGGGYVALNLPSSNAGSSSQVYQKAGIVEPPEPPQQFEYVQVHMAMPVTLTVWAKNRHAAEVACKAAFARITELEAIFNDYSNQSETGRFNQLSIGASMRVSDELIELLQFSKELSQKTDSVFDPTMGVAIGVWRVARKTKTLPSKSEIKRGLESGGFETLHWQRLPAEQTLAEPAGRAPAGSAATTANRSPDQSQWQLKRLGVSRLDFGAVAKGYIGDQVLQTLRQHGIHSACYEAGGDIVCSAAPPNTDGWEVELPKLGKRRFQNVGIAVSGDTNQFVEIEGQRYSHVIDFRTGMGITTRRMSVVIANSGALSDALATTGCVMTEAEFQKLTHEFENAEAISFRVEE